MNSAIKYLLSFLIFFSALATAQHGHDHGDEAHDHAHQAHWIKYAENKGQWGEDLFFLARTGAMDIYIGDGKFTLQLKSGEDYDNLHAQHHGEIGFPEAMPVRFHNIEFALVDANPTQPIGQNMAADYVNYFLGNDPKRWAGEVRQFGEVISPSVYPGIDMHLASIGHHMKYEFTVAPGANPDQIQFIISGADDLYLSEGKLHLNNSIDLLIDDTPIAWQTIDGTQGTVPCAYRLSGDTLSFDVGKYDKTEELIIDPTLIFATLMGSASDNWGSTATYDSLGNMYTGGIVIGPQNVDLNHYPTTTGAFQLTYNGGASTGFGTDIVISKINGTGTNLIYSTYLGGENNEIPHSLVVNGNNELYLLGTTSSSMFPTSLNPYDGTFNGGDSIGTGGAGNLNSNSVGYPNGSDIVVTKFSANGNVLLGSTYVGGSGNDGINMSDTLQRAYADEFRGEIIVDANDNCYIATSTGSDNFPIVNGFQNVYGGGTTDGVVFKFNSNLTALLWSTYIGGLRSDAAYSLQFDPNFDVFVTGGTESNNFPVTTGVINGGYQGGISDGWVAKISNNGQTLLASTFLGTDDYDQSFFVQLDQQGFVYTVGHSIGNYPVGPNWVYSVPNSGQFLHKLSNDLQSTEFSTRWGSSTNAGINLSLSAFLVNECNNIFIAGWGGGLFGTGSVFGGASSVSGLPTTNNAIQPATADGSDMYFLVLSDSALGVLFGSYYGGNVGEHVDGGTSRFDKKGIIYQAVCASCGGGATTFPTFPNPGVWSSQDSGANCNLGAIKYDLVTLDASADVDGPTTVCINDSIQFQNESIGGSLFFWDFGDGNTSDEFEPRHAYPTAGTYQTMLVIYDSVSCIEQDTDYIAITVQPGPTGQVEIPDAVCPFEPAQMQASGGTQYLWSPSTGVDNSGLPNPIATVGATTLFTVYVSDSCATDTLTVELPIHVNSTSVSGDTSLCRGQSSRIYAFGGSQYEWSPDVFLSDTDVSNPVATPDSTIEYNVDIVDLFGCERSWPVKIYIEGFVPIVEASGDTAICDEGRVVLEAKGASNYEWFPKGTILNPFLNSTPAYPEETTMYKVRSFNSCGYGYDSILVKVEPVELYTLEDTAICEGDSAQLQAFGSLTYYWEGDVFSQPNYNPAPKIRPEKSGWYRVTGENSIGCSTVDSMFVSVFDVPNMEITTDADTITGLYPVWLVVESDYDFTWSSEGDIPCDTCDSILVAPLYKTWYYATAFTDKGCIVEDSISVYSISKIFIPNTFTPDFNGTNEEFKAQGHNILDFSMRIYDRWGHVVFNSSHIDHGWNGRKFNDGEPVQLGAYSYVVRYTILPGQEQVQTGVVNVLR